MSLTSGTKLGPYEILSPLGAGGMGEVYRARDAKLNRDVAIKVLLPSVASDPDRLARFSREAQVLASLNHPNIAAIYGIEESNGVSALVMELVEGEDLSQRIARGAIPLDEALPIARQIAEALEAAHEQGIIHRDLKPANIKVRSDGTVKVLDFGLAKAMDTAGGAGRAGGAGQDAIANSPTLSIHATEAGLILGTAAYMSPEQAAGKSIDKRSDLWAFGVVLFEMLAGHRVFGGETTSHVLAAVLKDEPAWTTLPRDTPPSIRKLLRRCLEKDRRRRLADAADARFEIEDALNPANEIAPVAAKRPWLPWAVAVLALVISGGLAWRSGGSAVSPVVYASLDAPAGTVLGGDDSLASLPMHPPMVFTPDGKSLIIQAARDGKPQLFIRSLDRPDARPIAGTEEARVPFVSPGGKWIGFWASGELRKVPIEGGTPVVICPLFAFVGPYGATWSVGDVIAFGDHGSGRIMRVSANGGTPVPVTATPPPATGRRHVTPFFLPDGKRLLFSDVSITDAKDTRLMVQSIDGGEPRTVVDAATDGRLLPSGLLAFMRLGTLMMVTFDPASAEIRGEAVAAVADVMQSGLRGRNGANNTGAGMFAVSSLGALAMVKGPLTGMGENVLAWGAADGRLSSAEPASGAPKYGRLFTRVSPDQSRAMVAVQTPLRMETWIADWTRNAWSICSGCGANVGLAQWSPDGQRVLVGRNDALVIHTPDGSAPDQTLVREANRFLVPNRWLADGRMVYSSSPDRITSELRMLEAGANAGNVVIPLGISYDADVSPDGRWLAYTSAESSPANVIVQPFPGPGPKLPVSAGGGRNPAWSRDGRTLYFLDLNGPGSSVFAADVRVADRITVGTPRQLFHQVDGQGCTNYRCYDIGDDGRFLFRERPAGRRQSVTRMELVLNWTATVGKGQ